MTYHWKHREAQETVVEMRRMEKLIQAARIAERARERERLLSVFGAEMGPEDIAQGDDW